MMESETNGFWDNNEFSKLQEDFEKRRKMKNYSEMVKRRIKAKSQVPYEIDGKDLSEAHQIRIQK